MVKVVTSGVLPGSQGISVCPAAGRVDIHAAPMERPNGRLGDGKGGG